MVPVRPITVAERIHCSCNAPACTAPHDPKTNAHFKYTTLVDAATGLEPQPGDIFFYPGYKEKYPTHVSRQFDAQHAASREVIVVILPNKEWFNVDGPYRTKGQENPERNGWTVTGEFPNITVVPSINCVGRWHGYLTAGVLGDDVEGRIFP